MTERRLGQKARSCSKKKNVVEILDAFKGHLTEK